MTESNTRKAEVQHVTVILPNGSDNVQLLNQKETVEGLLGKHIGLAHYKFNKR